MGPQIPGKELPFKREKRKLNLDPFKDQLQKWEDEGIASSDLVDIFEQWFHACTSKLTIESFLQTWRTPTAIPTWREVESQPFRSNLAILSLPADLLTREELQVLGDGIRTACLEIIALFPERETMQISSSAKQHEHWKWNNNVSSESAGKFHLYIQTGLNFLGVRYKSPNLVNHT